MNKEVIIENEFDGEPITSINIPVDRINIPNDKIDTLKKFGYEIKYQRRNPLNIPKLFSFLHFTKECGKKIIMNEPGDVEDIVLIHSDYMLISSPYAHIIFENCDNYRLEDILHIINGINSYDGGNYLKIDFLNNSCTVSLEPMKIDMNADEICSILFGDYLKIREPICKQYEKEYLEMFLTELSNLVLERTGEKI